MILLDLGVVFLLLLNVIDQCEQFAELLLAVLLEEGHTELKAFTTGQQLHEVIVQ